MEFCRSLAWCSIVSKYLRGQAVLFEDARIATCFQETPSMVTFKWDVQEGDFFQEILAIRFGIEVHY